MSGYLVLIENLEVVVSVSQDGVIIYEFVSL